LFILKTPYGIEFPILLRCLHQDPGLETGDGAGEVSGRGTRAMPGRWRGLCQAGFVFVLKLGENSVLLSRYS
jgi:hypothetical protein